MQKNNWSRVPSTSDMPPFRMQHSASFTSNTNILPLGSVRTDVCKNALQKAIWAASSTGLVVCSTAEDKRDATGSETRFLHDQF